MHQSISMRSPRNLTRSAPESATVCVVDPSKSAYGAWQTEAEEAGMVLHLCGTADEALRLARNRTVDLWVVNAALPGLSGYELCSMLKARSGHAPVYLVADEYSPAAEQAAWQSRATLFGCKGQHIAWLGHWWRQRQRLTDSSQGDRCHLSAVPCAA